MLSVRGLKIKQTSLFNVFFAAPLRAQAPPRRIVAAFLTNNGAVIQAGKEAGDVAGWSVA